MPKNIFRRPGQPCMVWISGNWSMFLVTHWSITLPELFSFLLSCYMGGVGQRLFYLRTKDRLHYDIFSCPCTHTHTTPLALTLWDLLLHLHTDRMLRYDIFFCNCTILHTHTLDTMSWCLFWDRIYQWIVQANFGKVTTDRQHEKRMENVQVKLFVIKLSKHIIREAFFASWSEKCRGARNGVITFFPSHCAGWYAIVCL